MVNGGMDLYDQNYIVCWFLPAPGLELTFTCLSLCAEGRVAFGLKRVVLCGTCKNFPGFRKPICKRSAARVKSHRTERTAAKSVLQSASSTRRE